MHLVRHLQVRINPLSATQNTYASASRSGRMRFKKYRALFAGFLRRKGTKCSEILQKSVGKCVFLWFSGEEKSVEILALWFDFQRFLYCVGVARFELATPCSQSYLICAVNILLLIDYIFIYKFLRVICGLFGPKSR